MKILGIGNAIVDVICKVDDEFIKKNNLNENVSADTAGSAKYVSDSNDKSKAAIASKLSAEIYNLEILKENIQDDESNVT